jgi:hypothetical protein
MQMSLSSHDVSSKAIPGIQYFMETGNTLPLSLEFCTGPYPESEKSCLNYTNLSPLNRFLYDIYTYF